MGRVARLALRDWGWAATLITGVGLLGLLGYCLSGLGDETTRTWGIDFAYVPVSALATLLCVRAARHRVLDRRVRRAWLIATAAAGCLLFANVAWWWLEAVRRSPVPFPSLADVGLLLSIPAMSAALLSFPTRPHSRHERSKLLLDVAMVVVGGFMVVWYLVLGPTVIAGGVSVFHAALTISYQVGDLALLWVVVTVLMREPMAASRRPVQILVGVLGLRILSDVYYGYASLHDGFGGGHWADAALLGSTYLLMVAAAVQYRQRSAPEVTATRWRRSVSRLPYAAVVMSYALLVLIARGQPFYPLGGLLLGAVVLTGLVVARQIVALRDNEHLIAVDPLTGLANRSRLRFALERALARRDATRGEVAFLMFDLDGFKQINDGLGHEVGDGVLAAFGQVLMGSVRGGDTAGRLGGDEFAIVLPDLKGTEGAVAVAERIHAALREPVQVGTHQVRMRTSIGIAVTADPATTAAELRHQADLAMYVAKQRGLHGYEVYGRDHDSAELARRQLEVDLARAVEREEFFLVYQPIVDMGTGEIRGVEALIRWQHPERGIVPPMEFIPACEESALIEQVGMWVLETACRQVRRWQEQVGPARHLHLNVNLSPRQTFDPEVVAKVADVLRRTGLDPGDLVLELTEGVLMDETGEAVDKLNAFKELGVRIAIDDFGTGFSSLSYLTRLPVDVLKIDRRFIAEMGHDSQRAAVAKTIVRLGQALHLDTVAEGIEERSQAADLLELGCSVGQGFYFARPQDADALGELLGRGRVASHAAGDLREKGAILIPLQSAMRPPHNSASAAGSDADGERPRIVD